MTQPKIKLLIPIEIKDGCELPERFNYCKSKYVLVHDGRFIISGRYNHVFKRWKDENGKIIRPSHWLKEVETDLTIDELKKIGVIK